VRPVIAFDHFGLQIDCVLEEDFKKSTDKQAGFNA
jgi:hypothetical protein